MNESKKKQLVQNLLDDRNIYDDYKNNSTKRRIIILFILIIIVGLIVLAIKNNTKQKSSFNSCKLDDCTTFDQELVKNIRYGYYVNNSSTKEYNCSYEKNKLDKIIEECKNNDNENTCSKFKKDKQFCYAFNKDNSSKIENLSFTNPTTLNGLEKLENLKNVTIVLDKNYTGYKELFSSINTLSGNNVSIRLYINDINENVINNIQNTLVDSDKLDICLFDKDICETFGLYTTYQDVNKVLNTFIGIKKDMLSEFKNPTDIEKVVFIYAYFLNNIKVDMAAINNEEFFSNENFQDIINKKLLSYLTLNQVGTYYSITNYFDQISKYVGLKTNIATYVNNTNNKEYIYNQINISGNWYNIDVTEEINNIFNQEKKYKFFLKSDAEFVAERNITLKEHKKADSSINDSKIDKIMSSIK